MPASAFDDDFFRTGERRVEPVSSPVSYGVSEPTRVMAGMAAPTASGQEVDELDIPAFLRRSH